MASNAPPSPSPSPSPSAASASAPASIEELSTNVIHLQEQFQDEIHNLKEGLVDEVALHGGAVVGLAAGLPADVPDDLLLGINMPDAVQGPAPLPMVNVGAPLAHAAPGAGAGPALGAAAIVVAPPAQVIAPPAHAVAPLAHVITTPVLPGAPAAHQGAAATGVTATPASTAAESERLLSVFFGGRAG